MKSIDTKSMQKEVESDSKEVMHIDLEIRDPIVIAYLSRFESEEERKEKALEALRVGIIAIQSASPVLDTRVVNEKFQQILADINKYIDDFKMGVSKQLEEYFKKDSGVVPQSLDSLFGHDGKIASLFEQYFHLEDGKVARLIQDQIGPSSQFAKCLDPNNKESVISQLEDMVQKHLEEKTKEMIAQFSLDKEDSAICRLKKMMDNFFKELRETIGIERGRELEAERGTEKGREFETALYNQVAEWGRQLGDQTENVTGKAGFIPNCKKGDYVITLGDTSGAPGVMLVIEAKKGHYNLKDAVEELKEAKKNRDATCGIMLFAKGYEPSEIKDFRLIGSDFFATIDEEALYNGIPLLYAESAYKIARAIAINTAKREEVKEIDLDKVHRDLEALSYSIKRISELAKKARKIQNESISLENLANELKQEMNEQLEEIFSALKGSSIK